jgi:ubiquinone/menaquinone biosynthesis C-methylase UbiE
MQPFKDNLPPQFTTPTSPPSSAEQAGIWQDANRTWWEKHPMRYDWRDGIVAAEFSPDFYRQIDSRFFADVWEYMPWDHVPFDALIPFNSLADKAVLEIGVGSGSHAELLAKHARSFTGIDITDYAIKSTSERFRLSALSGVLLRMDAEAMEFEDNSFDFIWTWGVIHHSADTRNILREMARVLRPGGRAITMVYHRNAWNYYIWNGFFQGLLRGDLFRSKSVHATMQRYTDGALARYYTVAEWRSLVGKFFEVEDISIYGSKAQIIPLPGGHAKDVCMKLLPNSISRLITNRLGLGTFLVSKLVKPL